MQSWLFRTSLLSRSHKLAACYMFLCSSNGFEIILKHEMSLLFNFNELFNRTGNSNNEKCKYKCVVLWTILGLGNNM